MTTEQQSNEFPRRPMFVIHSMRGGGSERQMSYLANEMASRAKTSLVTLDGIDNDAYPLDSKIERIGLGLTSERGGFFRGLSANFRRINALKSRIIAWKPDIVVSFCDTTNILTLIACPATIPVLISERNDPRRQRLSRHWEFMRSIYYPKCKTCVAQTDEVGNYLISKRLVAHSKMVIVPSAISIPNKEWDSIDSLRKSAHPKTLLYLGRLSPQKRVDRLLKAWAKLTAHHGTWQLRIVGDGELRASLQALANDLGIAKSVVWSLWSDDAWHYLCSANAFCLVSDYEGYPQAMLEAMGAGLPVAVFDCGPAIRHAISDGIDGLVIPSEDQITVVLNRMLSSDSLRNTLGQKAAEQAKYFEWPTIAPQWLAAMASCKIPRG